MILIVGGIKGGTGKTTLATNIAVYCRKQGKKTILIDADDQKSSRDWYDERLLTIGPAHENYFPVKCLTGRELYTNLVKFKKEYEEIIVDTGGRDTESQRSSLTVADTFLLPFKPRSFDIWTLASVKSIINDIEAINKKMKSIAVINQADPKGTDNLQAVDIIKELASLTICPSFIGCRKVFSNASSKGLSVFEYGNDKHAVNEMLKLCKMIYI